jgi:hypothetical protein
MHRNVQFLLAFEQTDRHPIIQRCSERIRHRRTAFRTEIRTKPGVFRPRGNVLLARKPSKMFGVNDGCDVRRRATLLPAKRAMALIQPRRGADHLKLNRPTETLSSHRAPRNGSTLNHSRSMIGFGERLTGLADSGHTLSPRRYLIRHCQTETHRRAPALHSRWRRSRRCAAGCRRRRCDTRGAQC